MTTETTTTPTAAELEHSLDECSQLMYDLAERYRAARRAGDLPRAHDLWNTWLFLRKGEREDQWALERLECARSV
jgi:hypothetical protein